jgi:SAM-dependent methyltransferase
MQIDWRLKSFLFSIFGILPASALYFTQHNISRRSRGHIQNLVPHRPNWEFHKTNIDRLNAKTLIEFGAGKNLIQNIFLSDTGIRQTVVDLAPMVWLPLVNNAIDALAAQGLVKTSTSVTSLDHLEQLYGIRYIAPFDMRNTNYDDASFDICISTNTFEHIPPADIQAILSELWRIIRPGGVISAVIDYSDHYSHTDKKISPLNYLRFSESKWRRFNHANHFQNRLRHTHYKELFTAAKFEIEKSETLNYCETSVEYFNVDSLTGEDTDFALTGRWILRV